MRSCRVLVLLAFATLFLPPAAGHTFDHGWPTGRRSHRVAAAAPTVAPVAQAEVAQGSFRLHLPLLRRAPEVTVRFGASADPDTNEVTQPATEFAAGIQRLYIDVRVVGAQGLVFRTDAIFPSGQRIVGPNLTVRAATEFDRYFLCQTTADACGTAEVALPQGVYTVEVFLNDALVRSEQATVR